MPHGFSENKQQRLPQLSSFQGLLFPCTRADMYSHMWTHCLPRPLSPHSESARSTAVGQTPPSPSPASIQRHKDWVGGTRQDEGVEAGILGSGRGKQQAGDSPQKKALLQPLKSPTLQSAWTQLSTSVGVLPGVPECPRKRNFPPSVPS